MNEDMTDKEKMEFVFGVREDDEPTVENWNREVAASLAQEEGLELNDDRWAVAEFLRKHFEEVGNIEHARDMSTILHQRFEKQGGLKYLYTLFPRGPVSQGCKIAGIPVPADSKSESFGNIA
jgi:tRNA 2-thiouridine synthesizing protein E